LAGGRGELDWPATDDDGILGPDKSGIKNLLNLILIANDAIPRGGFVRIKLARDNTAAGAVIRADIQAEGPGARLGDGVEAAFNINQDTATLNPKSAPACLAAFLASSYDREISVMPGIESVAFSVEMLPTQ
jgi:hypothetical protein